MIDMMEGFPDNVIAASASGRVTRRDYEGILTPRIGKAAQLHAKLRCYYQLGGDFASMEPGAIWDDFVLGVEYSTRWERVAVVTDVPWIAHAANIFRFLMPGLVRVFPTLDRDEARAWIRSSP